MGTLVFVILWLTGAKAQPNDYQVLPLLLSLDSIALMLLLHLLRCRKPSPPQA